MNEASSSKRNPDHILLIDDNKLGLIARRSVLEELGYRITTAATALEGLKLFNEGGYSLIITDYKMPRMNGVELISKIREKEPRMPIILLSGFADALGLQAEDTGADVVIQKSANEVAHMMRAVRRLLRARKPPAPRKAPASQPVPDPPADSKRKKL